MLINTLIVVGFLAAWFLLSPCSPLSIWPGGACAWKPAKSTDSKAAPMKTIHPPELQQLIASSATVDLIDVRSPAEYAQGHAKGAISAPLDRLDPRALVARRKADPGQPIYLICQAGGRSATACQQFLAAGFPEVHNVVGGTSAWIAAGLPTETGAPAACCTR